MNILCVDDEPAVLGLVVSMCEDMPWPTTVTGFTRVAEALEWLGANRVDVALLDVNMPGASGIDLARAVKHDSPETAIVFLTGYADFAVDAFAMHASGYVLKPVSRERLREELEHAAPEKARGVARVEARTFGNFDLLVDGRPVAFARSMAKELLAYLVDRRGSAVTRREAFAVLWEHGRYDRPMQKQLDAVIRSMRSTLEDNGVGDIVEMQRGTLRIVPERINCDLYRFIKGDSQAVSSFLGEYLSSYPWARTTEGYLVRMKERGGE